MLKKAGMVVLGATAGMISLAPLANAGEAPSHDGDHGHHHGHHHDGAQVNDCGRSEGLVNVACVANNAKLQDINILAHDEHGDEDGRGGGQYNNGGHSSGLVNVANVLNNPSISDVNVLATDG